MRATRSSIARRDLIAEGKKADVALDFEGLAVRDGKDMGSIARRSAGSWTLTVTGKSAHSSGVGQPGTGYGAIYELARIIDQFRRELPEDKLTFNVGLIGGGAIGRSRRRQDPAAGDRQDQHHRRDRGGTRRPARDQPGADRPGAGEDAGDRRASRLPARRREISFDEDGYPPMAPTAGNRALLGQLNGVNRDLGLAEMGELDPLERGAGDISFVAADVDGLVGLGPASFGDHTPKETLEVPSSAKQAKRAAILMSRLARERRGKRSEN